MGYWKKGGEERAEGGGGQRSRNVGSGEGAEMGTGGGGGQRERGIPHKERKTMSFRYREEVKKRKKGEQGRGGEIVPSLKPGLG